MFAARFSVARMSVRLRLSTLAAMLFAIAMVLMATALSAQATTTALPKIGGFTSAGALDLGFGVGSGFDNSVFSVARQADGKIIAVGAFTHYKGVSANRIVRLNTDGSIDTSFAYGSGFSNVVYSVAIDTDPAVAGGYGVFVAGGYLATYNGSNVNNYVTLLDSSGALDTTFKANLGTMGMASNNLQSIAVYGANLVVGGPLGNMFGQTVNATGIASLTATGANRGTFNGTFAGKFSAGAAVRVVMFDGSGNLYVGGSIGLYDTTTISGLVRFSSAGVFDATFSQAAFLQLGSAPPQVWALAMEAGKLVVGGAFTTYQTSTAVASNIARLDAITGALDTGFNTAAGSGFDDTVNALAVDSSGNLLIGGGFHTYKGVTVNHITRLTSADAVDLAFRTAVGGTGSTTAFGDDPNANYSGAVRTFALNGSAFFAGGDFITWGGTTYGTPPPTTTTTTTTTSTSTSTSSGSSGANGSSSSGSSLAATGSDATTPLAIGALASLLGAIAIAAVAARRTERS